MPRSSSQASKGPRIAPASWRSWQIRVQRSSALAVTRAPAMRSVWPFRYLVAECMTRSAPSASGRVRTGVAAVLSIARRAPALWARSATAAMSAIAQVGLAGVSSQISLVRAGADRGLDRGEVARVDQVEGEAPGDREGQEPVAQAPVHDLGGDHVVARAKRQEERGRGRHAGGEQEAALAAFQGVEQRFGVLDGRVVGAAVAPAAAVLVVGVAQVGAGRVERRDQGAGRRVGAALGLGGQRRGMLLEVGHGRSPDAMVSGPK